MDGQCGKFGGDSTCLRGLDECRGSECNERLTNLGQRQEAHCAGRAIALVQRFSLAWTGKALFFKLLGF
jgi:hypothetical protein